MSEAKIAEEVADAEFERFALEMDLDVDVEKMSEEVAAQHKVLRRVVLRAMQRGSLIIDVSGQPIYTPQYDKDKTPITFYAPTGATLMSMDKRKESEPNARKFNAMGDMTKTSAGRFGSMDGRDLKVCQAMYLLFLAF